MRCWMADNALIEGCTSQKQVMLETFHVISSCWRMSRPDTLLLLCGIGCLEASSLLLDFAQLVTKSLCQTNCRNCIQAFKRGCTTVYQIGQALCAHSCLLPLNPRPCAKAWIFAVIEILHAAGFHSACCELREYVKPKSLQT